MNVPNSAPLIPTSGPDIIRLEFGMGHGLLHAKMGYSNISHITTGHEFPLGNILGTVLYYHRTTMFTLNVALVKTHGSHKEKSSYFGYCPLPLTVYNRGHVDGSI